MRALLDTHALLWAATEPERLSGAAREVLLDPSNVLLVSAATAWEIATKVRLQRWPQAEVFERDFADRVRAAGYEFRSVTVEDGLRAGRLLGEHQDPFDRMIAAQALAADMPVVSVDAKLDGFGVRRIW